MRSLFCRLILKCSQATKVKCTEVCDKVLNCGRHSCRQVCHPGSCEPCDEDVHQGTGRRGLGFHQGRVCAPPRCGTWVVPVVKALLSKQRARAAGTGRFASGQPTSGFHSGATCDGLPHAAWFLAECFCGKEQRDVVCGTADSFSKQFTCHQPCDRWVLCEMYT